MPVDLSLGERRRRIWVGGINQALIRSDGQLPATRSNLAFPPNAWSDEHAMAPLELAEPFASQGAENPSDARVKS